MATGSAVLLQAMGNGVIWSQVGTYVSPANGHSVYVYQRGTTTQVDVYSDTGLSSLMSQPLSTGSWVIPGSGQLAATPGSIPGYVEDPATTGVALDFYDATQGVRMPAYPSEPTDVVPQDSNGNPVFKSPAASSSLLGLDSSGKVTAGPLTSSVVTVITPSGDTSGVTDTAAINAATATGCVRLKRGGVYYTDGTLYFSANSLDATDAIINAANGGFCMAANYGSLPVATATDGATTASSATINTSLGATAVTALANGETIAISVMGASAAGANCPFIGLVASATSTSVTVEDFNGSTWAPATTVSSAAVALFVLDQSPRLVGGTWNKGSNTGGGITARMGIQVAFAQDHYVWPQRITSTFGTDNGHAIDLGAVIRGSAGISQGVNFSGVGIQLKGPFVTTHIGFLRGSLADDGIAITCNDWPSHGLTGGNGWGCVSDGVATTSTNGYGFKVIAGAGNTVDGIQNRVVHGAVQYGGVYIGDDSSQGATTGGTYGDIDFGKCDCVVNNAGSALIRLYSPAANVIRGRLVSNPNQSALLEAAAYVLGSSTATIGLLALDFDCAGSVGYVVGAIYGDSSTVTINRILATGYWKVTKTNQQMIRMQNCIVDKIDVDMDVTMTSSSLDFVVEANAAATINRVRLRGTYRDAYNLGYAQSGYTGTTEWIVDGDVLTAQNVVQVFGGTHNVTLLQPYLSSVSTSVVNTTGATVRVTGSVQKEGLGSSTLVHRAASESVSVNGPDFAQDLATLTPQEGDMVYDNQSRTGALGVAIYHSGGTGNGWKNLYTGGTY